ncbi:hypothetical protein L596_000036 [Steinernema carpocapsae]|uniref:Uncharacterized protein n=1 Tax=Steinernema carpocapsae TaxID=34508 RepID=A0A4U8UHF3_STECR|nr:hypothetical protein L596_000036 [Steinernema carpocapsae]
MSTKVQESASSASANRVWRQSAFANLKALLKEHPKTSNYFDFVFMQVACLNASNGLLLLATRAYLLTLDTFVEPILYVELATLLPSHQAALALLYVTTKEKSKIEAKARDLVFKSTSLDKNMVSFYATIIDRLRQNDFSDERFTETISAEIIFAHEAELEKEVKTKQLRTPTNSPHGRRSLRVTPNRPCPIVLRTSGSKRRRSEDIRETSCEYVPIASKKLVPSNDDSGISLGILTPESSQPERSQGFISLNRLVPW